MSDGIESGTTGRRYRVVGGAALLTALGLGVLALASTPGDDAGSGGAAAPEALPVNVVEVRLRDELSIVERLAGRVVGRRRGALGFERGGRIDRVEVDEGARVEAGEVLAALDTRDLAAARRELAARVAATDARLELARTTARRQRELSRSDYLSPQDLDEAVANETALEAQLAADRAALERTEVALELSRLVAPYDAVVVERLADEGSILGAGQAVLRILEDGPQEVHLGVPPQIADRLEVGATHRVESAELEAPAVLRTVLPQVDPETRTRTAILEVTASEAGAPRLLEGSLVWVRLARSLPMRGAWLPIGALAEGRRGTWTSYAVVRAQGGGPAHLERRQVEILHTEETRAFVRGTLRDGDRIVRDGLHRLVPGLRVRVVGADGPA